MRAILLLLVGCADKGDTGAEVPLESAPCVWITVYADRDGDGHGDPSAPSEICDDAAGLTTLGDDCDDTDPGVHPDQPEVCDPDNTDEDCDGEADDQDSDVDDSSLSAWYADLDGDGYGDPDAPQPSACEAPPLSSADGTDCDDSAAEVHPGAAEVCGDGLDNGCTGAVGGCRATGELPLYLADARWLGEAGGDALGGALASLGDVDGDGAPDALAGAEGAERAYVLSGAATGELSASAALARMDGTAAVLGFGAAVLGPGDLDGDGYADAVVGAPDGDVAGAAVYRGPLLGTIDTADDQHTGPIYSAGQTLAASDGALLIGCPREGAGEIRWGPWETGWDALAVITGAEDNDQASGALALGDTSGDGVADLAVGSIGADGAGDNRGALALALGPWDDLSSLADADATWVGQVDSDYAGSAVAVVGDVDGDGLADLLVGVEGDDTAGTTAGAAALFLGATAPVGGTTTLAVARLTGAGEGDRAGGAVSGPGDLDGDGTSDLLVGAWAADAAGSTTGAAYVVYGPVSGRVDLGAADWTLTGEDDRDAAGISLAGAGDVQGDGALDLWIGATGEGSVSSGNGAVYLVAGVGL